MWSEYSLVSLPFKGEKMHFCKILPILAFLFHLFLIHVIVLYKDVPSYLIGTSFMEPQTFTSLVACWQHMVVATLKFGVARVVVVHLFQLARSLHSFTTFSSLIKSNSNGAPLLISIPISPIWKLMNWNEHWVRKAGDICDFVPFEPLTYSPSIVTTKIKTQKHLI